jgi:fructose-bisphosphate aldolase class II
MLVPLPHLLAQARAGNYALGYFEAWDSYSLEAVIEAAEAENAPVILGFGCMMVSEAWLDAGGIEGLGKLGRTLAERARVPAALLLNEAHTYEECLTGMQAGFNAVMLDTSTWQTWPALEQTRHLVQVAHEQGVAVEAELGHLPDATERGIDSSLASLTDPDEAGHFVERTGIDCLAVSIGNVHLLTRGLAAIDLPRLKAIYQRTALPLVIHGGTGFPPDAVPQAIEYGAAKFNVGTILKKTFLDGVRDSVGALDAAVNVHDVMGSHREQDYLLEGKRRLRAKVQELIQLYGSSSQARGI